VRRHLELLVVTPDLSLDDAEEPIYVADSILLLAVFDSLSVDNPSHSLVNVSEFAGPAIGILIHRAVIKILESPAAADVEPIVHLNELVYQHGSRHEVDRAVAEINPPMLETILLILHELFHVAGLLNILPPLDGAVG